MGMNHGSIVAIDSEAVQRQQLGSDYYFPCYFCILMSPLPFEQLSISHSSILVVCRLLFRPVLEWAFFFFPSLSDSHFHHMLELPGRWRVN